MLRYSKLLFKEKTEEEESGDIDSFIKKPPEKDVIESEKEDEDKSKEKLKDTDMVMPRSISKWVKKKIKRATEGTIRGKDVDERIDVKLVPVHKKLKEHDEKLDKHEKRLNDHDKTLQVHEIKLTKHDEILKEHEGKIAKVEGTVAEHGVKLEEHGIRITKVEGNVANHEMMISGLDETLKKHEKLIKNINTDLDSVQNVIKEIKDNRKKDTERIQEVENEIIKIKEGDYGTLSIDQINNLKKFFIKLGIVDIDFLNGKLNVIDNRIDIEIKKLNDELKKGMLTEPEKKAILDRLGQLEAFRTLIDKKVDDFIAKTEEDIKKINEKINKLTTGGLTDAEKEALKNELKAYLDAEIIKIKDTLKDSRLSDDEVAKLKAALTALVGIQTTLDQYGANIKEINLNIENLYNQIRDVQDIFAKDIAELREQIKGLAGLDPELIKKILEALKNIEALNARVATLEGTVEGLKDLPGTVATIRTELDALKDQVKGIKGLTPEQEKMLNEAAAKLDEHTKQIEKLGTDLSATTERVGKVEGRVEKVELDVESIKKTLEKFKDFDPAVIAEIQKMLKELNIEELKKMPAILDEVENSLTSLQSSTKNFREDIDDLIASNENLHDQITNLRRVQTEMDNRLKALESLKAQIEELLKMKEELEKVKGLVGRVEQLEGSVKKAQEDITRLDLSDEDKRKRIEAIERDIKELNDLKEKLKEIDAIKARVAALETLKATVEQMEKDLKKNMEDVKTLQEKDAKRDEEIKAINARLEELEKVKLDMDKIKELFAITGQRLDLLEKDNVKVQNAINKLQALSKRFEELDAMQKAISVLQANWAEFTQLRDKITKDQTFQQADIDKLKLGFKDLDKKFAAINKLLEAVNGQITDLETDVNGLENADVELKQSVTDIRGKMNELSQLTKRLEQDVEWSKDKIGIHDTEIEAIQDQLKELEKFKLDMDKIKELFAITGQRLDLLEKDNVKVQNAINKLQALSSQAEGLKAAQESISRMQADINKLGKVQDFQQADIDKLKKYRDEIDALSTGLHDMNQHILALEEDIKALGDTDEALKNSISELQQTVAKIKDLENRMATLERLLNQLLYPGPAAQKPFVKYDDRSAEIQTARMEAHEERRGRPVGSKPDRPHTPKVRGKINRRPKKNR